MKRIVLAVLGCCLLLGQWASPARAVLPDEMLKDPALEARARDISLTLRCVVCQNQSIDDSNAPLAHDLRVLVRERLSAGDTNKQAIDYIVQRYGNFVLLKPPLQLDTALLWFGPLLLAGLAFVVLRRTLLAQGGAGSADGGAATAAAAPAPLSAAEKAELDRLMGDGRG